MLRRARSHGALNPTLHTNLSATLEANAGFDFFNGALTCLRRRFWVACPVRVTQESLRWRLFNSGGVSLSRSFVVLDAIVTGLVAPITLGRDGGINGNEWTLLATAGW